MSSENLGQVPTPTGSLSTFSNSRTSLYGEEIVKFPFRLNIPISPNPDPDTEFTAFVLPIDATLQKAFFDAFEYYTFESLTLDLQCTAPLGTASGAVQVGYFSDPLNAGVPTTLSEAKAKLGSTDGWVMIRPRDSKSLQIPVDVNPMLPGWRFVRDDAANVRMSSFGAVVGITAEPPAVGDGTVYEGWLHGWAIGKRRTQQTGATAAYMRFRTSWQLQKLEWDYNVGCPVIGFVGFTSLKVGNHSKVNFLFDDIISGSADITGSDKDGAVLSAKVYFDFSAVAGYLVTDSLPLVRFALPKLAELGFTSEGLVAKNVDAIRWALDASSATVMYRPSISQLNPNSFNQAKFLPKSTAQVSVIDTSKKVDACVISGRAIPGQSDEAHSAFGF